MRIISGSAGGRTLKAPKGTNTRPTIDRVREAMFSVIASYVPDAKVLDAFGGSGALGIEALSRGAASVLYFEKDRLALAAIKDNLQTTGFHKQARVVSGMAEKLLENYKEGFDLVFLDPPYAKGLVPALEPILLMDGILAEDALVVVETSTKGGETFESDRWELYKTKTYGDTTVLYYGLQDK